MNCKDCTHYEACNYWLEKEKKHLNCEEGFICEHFKDKFECIQLPRNIVCRYSPVYRYSPKYLAILPYFVDTGNVGFLGHKNDWANLTFYATCAKALEVFDEIDFKLEDIGKTVFLTYEEAEKTLQEDCNENN